MASSAHQNHHHLSNPYGGGATSAPPPTPSSQSNLNSTSEATTAADALSYLLHRLPPTLNLSLRSRRSSDSTVTAVAPPLISLSENDLCSNILSAATSHGFFQLTDHCVSSELAHSAESECVSLFQLTQEEKLRSFPTNWPLGYGDDDENETGVESLCLDSSCSTESTELELSSLKEFTCEMEKLGMKVLEVVLNALGFDNPTREVCPLMWVSHGGGSKSRPNLVGRMYPYVVGLQYQLRSEKHTMLADSGWVSATPRTGSVLVTLGDIAQVWCNGNLKKVRGRPARMDDSDNYSNFVSMTLLITLPIENIVTPLFPKLSSGDLDYDEQERKEEDVDEGKERRLFNSFSFEDYAWRIYHERVPTTKDPLVRYHV